MTDETEQYGDSDGDGEGEDRRKKRKRRQPKPLTYERMEAAAFRHLERFACSAEELARVLERKVWRTSRVHPVDEDEARKWIKTIVAKMQRLSLIDDEAYAEMKTRSLANRGKGRRAIRWALAAKGVDEQFIEDAIDEYATEEGDIDRIAAVNLVKRRRLGPMRPADKRETFFDKDLGALARAGIPLGLAREVLALEDEDALLSFAEEAREA